MRRKPREIIRELLRNHPDGLTIPQIVTETGIINYGVNDAIKRMPDVYIDRWKKSKRQHLAVYVAVHVPENCPKPRKAA